MPRRYRRRRYAISRPVKTTKYSNETYNFNYQVASLGGHGQQAIPILPVLSSGAILGTRKVKNFTVKLQAGQTEITDPGGDSSAEPSSIAWALVFVSEGNQPSQISVSTTSTPSSLYEPNQNVIMSGLIDNKQVYVSKSRLARNLNSGDQLYLVFYDVRGVPPSYNSVTKIYGAINFAIAF